MPSDPTGSSSSPEPLSEPQAPSGYLVRHNDMIVGIFNNEADAQDAKNGYEMNNDVQLDDNLDILQIL